MLQLCLRILVVIHFFNVTAQSPEVKIFDHPIWIRHFLSVYFRTPWNRFITKAPIFSEKHWLYWNESHHLKQLPFRRKIFFRIPSCMEKLSLSNNYLLVQHSYCFGGAFSPQYVMIQNMYFIKTDTSSKQLLCQKRNFLIVLRNQFHYICTWKDFSLTSTHSCKFRMVWSEITQPFIVENSEQLI